MSATSERFDKSQFLKNAVELDKNKLTVKDGGK